MINHNEHNQEAVTDLTKINPMNRVSNTTSDHNKEKSLNVLKEGFQSDWQRETLNDYMCMGGVRGQICFDNH